MKRLCFCIILAVLGISNFAFAQVYNLSEILQAQKVYEYPFNTSVDAMDTVIFGSYPQTDDDSKDPVEWLVLDGDDKHFLLLSKYLIDEDFSYISDGTSWLNKNFYHDAFALSERNQILYLDREVENGISLYSDEMKDSKEPKIFRLTVKDLQIHFPGVDYYKTDERLKAYSCKVKKSNSIDVIESDSWSLDSWSGFVHDMVDSDGCVRPNSGWDLLRPAIWISLDGLKSNSNNSNNINLEESKQNNNSANNSVISKNDSDLSNQIRHAKLITEYSAETTVDQMDTISFGSYPQSDVSGNTKEPIEWIVLDRQEDKAFLLSKYILDCKDYEPKNWETSYVRTWLNKQFYYSAFNDYEKKFVKITSVDNQESGAYTEYSGAKTNDRIFILSDKEADNYFGGLDENNSNKRLAAKGTKYAQNVDNNGDKLYVTDYSNELDWGEYDIYSWCEGNSEWWLRSNRPYNVYVSSNGGNGTPGDNTFSFIGVRPAMWVTLNNNVSNSELTTNNNTTNNQKDERKILGKSINEIGVIDTDQFKSVDEYDLGKIKVEALDSNNGNSNQNILGDNVHIEGADVYQNPDGSIQIGGTPQEGAKVQDGWVNDTYYRNGIKVVNEWIDRINGSFITKNGEMTWFDNGRYYLGSDGLPEKSKWIGDYYVDDTGKLLTKTITPDGKRVDGTGKLIVNNSDAIIDENFTGLKDGWYYVNGVKQIDTWVRIDGYNYRFDKDGHNYILNPKDDSSNERESIDDNQQQETNIEDNINSIGKKTNDKNKVYYYAKQDSKNNKMYKTISKKKTKGGLFGTGLFNPFGEGILKKNNKTYYLIEMTLNDETTERLNRYADFSEQHYTFRNAIEWVMLYGNTMNNLNVLMDNYGSISPATKDARYAAPEISDYYQNGKIQLSFEIESERDSVYNKIVNAQVLLIATNNVIKSHDTVFYEEDELGNVSRFEYVEDDGSHVNFVTAYVDCEDRIVEYTSSHVGYQLYVKDGITDYIIHKEYIYEPITKFEKFDIFIMGHDSLSYAIQGNKISHLAEKGVSGMNKFRVYGGRIVEECELNTYEGFEDFEKYYVENKDKW